MKKVAQFAVGMLEREGKSEEYEKQVCAGLAEGRETGICGGKKWEVLPSIVYWLLLKRS